MRNQVSTVVVVFILSLLPVVGWGQTASTRSITRDSARSLLIPPAARQRPLAGQPVSVLTLRPLIDMPEGIAIDNRGHIFVVSRHFDCRGLLHPWRSVVGKDRRSDQ